MDEERAGGEWDRGQREHGQGEQGQREHGRREHGQREHGRYQPLLCPSQAHPTLHSGGGNPLLLHGGGASLVLLLDTFLRPALPSSPLPLAPRDSPLSPQSLSLPAHPPPPPLLNLCLYRPNPPLLPPLLPPPPLPFAVPSLPHHLLLHRIRQKALRSRHRRHHHLPPKLNHDGVHVSRRRNARRHRLHMRQCRDRHHAIRGAEPTEARDVE